MLKVFLGGNEEFEWRIFFFIVEGKLMRVKGFGNRNYCYRMFKMVIKENIILICKFVIIYYLKIFFFWVSERYLLDRWLDENVVLCFLGLVDDLLYFLVICLCFYYFILELNLFVNCSTDYLYLIVSKVFVIRKFFLRYF